MPGGGPVTDEAIITPVVAIAVVTGWTPEPGAVPAAGLDDLVAFERLQPLTQPVGERLGVELRVNHDRPRLGKPRDHDVVPRPDLLPVHQVSHH